MKKFIIFVLICCVILSLTACGNKQEEVVDIPNEEDDVVYISDEGKEEIPLGYMEKVATEFLIKDEKSENVSIDCTSFESEEQAKLGKGEVSDKYKPFIDYITDKFGIVFDENWVVQSTDINAENGVGAVRFEYRIKGIETDRYITFFIVDNNAYMVTYSGLENDIDAEEIAQRRDVFESKYKQGVLELNENQVFKSSVTQYLYSFNTDLLIYNFVYTYAEGTDEILNSDYSTVRYIDKDGHFIEFESNFGENETHIDSFDISETTGTTGVVGNTEMALTTRVENTNVSE